MLKLERLDPSLDLFIIVFVVRDFVCLKFKISFFFCRDFYKFHFYSLLFRLIISLSKLYRRNICVVIINTGSFISFNRISSGRNSRLI